MAAITWQRAQQHEHEQHERSRPVLRLVAPPARRHPDAGLYRRRRMVLLVGALAVVVLAVQLWSSTTAPAGAGRAPAGAGRAPAAPTVVVAGPGDTYWSLAGEVYAGGDRRASVDAMVDANGGRELHVGDRIVVPR